MMQVAKDNPDAILEKIPLNNRLLNRINSINKKLRNKLRETYTWCK